MTPTIGRTVHYTLSEGDAAAINKRRTDAQISGVARENSGAVVHYGNSVVAGDIFPMVIVRVWGDRPDSAVNGQVLLDGNDVYWATSRNVGEGQGHFSWPTRS